MNYKRFINRFNELYNKSHLSGWKSFYWIDYFINFILYGTSLNDYFAYGFYKLRPNGKNEYITYRRYHKIQDICNNKNDIEILRDKSKFNVYFSKFVKRESQIFNELSLEEFKAFFAKYHIVFVKNMQSFRGKGISCYSDEQVDIKDLYSQLKGSGSSYLLEPKISQIKEFEDFHPWSVNTIRVITVYDDKKDLVHIMNARVRLGNNKNNVDNLHAGGIGANIDLKTGIVDTPGRDMYNTEYVVHPISGKQIVGFQVPYWKECIEFTEKAARHIPTIRYVGWDIVIQKNGAFLLIEGNDNADHDFQQLLGHKGLWKEYKAILKDLS